MCLYKPDRCYLLTCGHFPRTRVSIQRYSTCLYLLTLLRNVKGTNIGDSSPRVTEEKTIRYDKSYRDCKLELGGKDHRSPSNRAQGHAYRQNACGVTSPTSRPQRHQKKKVFQNSAYMLKFVDKPNETIKYIWQSR